MEGAPRALVHALKYRGVRNAAPRMAELLAPRLSSFDIEGAYAVPLHPSRERSRGFNQAELLRRALDLSPGPGSLRRVKRTKPQVGRQLRDRQQAVAGAFSFGGADLSGLRIAVIDDVITTGSTMQACATILREAGARSVLAVAFARAGADQVVRYRDV
jgi:ComF family protein